MPPQRPRLTGAGGAGIAPQAKNSLARLIGPGDCVYLYNARPGRHRCHYSGRMIAEVRSPAGELFAPSLIHAKLAVPFTPGRRPNWCHR